MIEVGDTLYGYCQGYFGRDSYGDKLVIAVGKRWIVVLEDDYGEKRFNSAVNLDVHAELAESLTREKERV